MCTDRSLQAARGSRASGENGQHVPRGGSRAFSTSACRRLQALLGAWAGRALRPLDHSEDHPDSHEPVLFGHQGPVAQALPTVGLEGQEAAHRNSAQRGGVTLLKTHSTQGV